MAVISGRRIQVILGNAKVPAVWLNPVFSSADVGWEGLLFERHTFDNPHVVEVPEHYSTKHLLRLNTGGRSTNDWRIEGRSRRTYDDPGGVSILPAGTPVSVLASSRTSTMVLEIDPALLKKNGVRPASADVELAINLTIPDRHIELLMNAMQADLEAGSPVGPLYGESLGNALITYLIKRYGTFAPKLEEYKGGLRKQRLNRVQEYIESNLEDNVSLSVLAEVAGVSMYHFAKAFKESTGATPHQYVLERKIDRAKELLHDPNRSVLEASVRTGFADQSHFTKMFRRMVGVTPSEYRTRT